MLFEKPSAKTKSQILLTRLAQVNPDYNLGDDVSQNVCQDLLASGHYLLQGPGGFFFIVSLRHIVAFTPMGWKYRVAFRLVNCLLRGNDDSPVEMIVLHLRTLNITLASHFVWL